ncbi:MAG: hypothetical protein NCW75_10670 [Phycisphaera sp.]|nr:MAG: hypothetical protein NCW75_10670 [Phycisphaera sp.]
MMHTPSDDITSSRDQPLFETLGCEGTLAWVEGESKHRHDFNVDVRIASDGAVSLVFSQCPLTKDNSWIIRVATSNSTSVPLLELRGWTEDGRLVHSDRVYVGGYQAGSGPEGAGLSFAATADPLTIVSPAATNFEPSRWRARYRLAGLRSFGSFDLELPVGRVWIAGTMDQNTEDELTGSITFE